MFSTGHDVISFLFSWDSVSVTALRHFFRTQKENKCKQSLIFDWKVMSKDSTLLFYFFWRRGWVITDLLSVSLVCHRLKSLEVEPSLTIIALSLVSWRWTSLFPIIINTKGHRKPKANEIVRKSKRIIAFLLFLLPQRCQGWWWSGYDSRCAEYNTRG